MVGYAWIRSQPRNKRTGHANPPYKRLLLILLAGDHRLFEIELTLDLAAGLIVDLAVAQQLIDVLALGRDQVHAHAGAERGGVRAFVYTLRKLLAARLVTRARQCKRVVRQPAGRGVLLDLA